MHIAGTGQELSGSCPHLGLVLLSARKPNKQKEMDIFSYKFLRSPVNPLGEKDLFILTKIILFFYRFQQNTTSVLKKNNKSSHFLSVRMSFCSKKCKISSLNIKKEPTYRKPALSHSCCFCLILLQSSLL